MLDAVQIYYRSPWEFQLLGCLLILLCVLVYYLVRYKSLSERSGIGRYAFLLTVLLVANGLVVNVMLGRAQRGPGLALFKDHFVCGHWFRNGQYLRPPWTAFTNITKEARGRFPSSDVVLRFEFKPEFADTLQATDTVRANGWVLCEVGGLTDESHRYGWPVDTDTIFEQVSAAWKAGLK